MKERTQMAKALLIFGAVAAAAIGILAHEIGTFCQEINPYNEILPNDTGEDFECMGCMGAAFGDCDYCASRRGCAASHTEDTK